MATQRNTLTFRSNRALGQCGRSILSVLAFGVSLLTAGTSVAQEVSPPAKSDTCDRIRASGASEASVLLAPRIGAQALRFPTASGYDPAGGGGSQGQVQVRAFADYSVTGAVRGLRTLDLADAACQTWSNARPLEDAIRVGLEQGRRAALAKQVAFLSAKEPEIARIEGTTTARLERQVGTLSEVSETRALTSELRQMRLDAEGEIELSAQSVSEPRGPLSAAVERYERSTMKAEGIGSSIRRLAPWELSVRGGVAAVGTSLVGARSPSYDWFGTVELSYNLGGIGRVVAENAFLAARSKELQSNRQDLGPAAREVDRALAASVLHLTKQIAALEELAEQLRRDQAALESAIAPKQPHALGLVALHLFIVEARLTYFRELLNQRRPWERHQEQ
jgi:hypothetical protein